MQVVGWFGWLFFFREEEVPERPTEAAKLKISFFCTHIVTKQVVSSSISFTAPGK